MSQLGYFSNFYLSHGLCCIAHHCAVAFSKQSLCCARLPLTVHLLLARGKKGAMVGDGWSNCAVAGAIVATVDIKKGDEIVVTTNLELL